MWSKWVLGMAAAAFVLVLGAAVYQDGTMITISLPAPSQPATSASTSTRASSSSSPSAPSGYTLAQVAQHNSARSCWTAINGNVYDLTQWIYQHPGGPDAIISICGIDGSAAFNAQHGGQSRPAEELKTFLIGPLVQ